MAAIFRMSTAGTRPWPASWHNAREAIEAVYNHTCYLQQDMIIYLQARPGGRILASRCYFAHPAERADGSFHRSQKIRTSGGLGGKK